MDSRRCPNCGAFDAWEPEPRRADLFDLICIEWTCGVCRRPWRIPIRPREVLA